MSIYRSKKDYEENLKMSKCIICGYTRYTEDCHIVPQKLGGGHGILNVVTLCPNHHKLLDYGLFSKEELVFIEDRIMALINLYHDDRVKQQYLYWLLKINNTPPMVIAKRIKILREKNKHIYNI